jgi:glycosyltransferase involved in cell wall biosynthesis
MKVALVGFDFGEYCIRLASGIAESEAAKVLLFLPQDEATPYLHLLSGSVERYLFNKPRMRQILKQFKMVIDLVCQIRVFKPDVIHLQLGQCWFNLLGLPLLRRFPLVLTVHDSQIHVGDAATGKTPQWVFDRACYQARERIVHAPQVKESLVRRLGIPAESVHVTPYAIVGDVEVTTCIELQEEPLILFFGRIWPYKGLEYLIRAEPLIRSAVPQAKIAIAGAGEDFSRYRRMMENPENFEVHNEFVSDEKRDNLFRRASVVVLPYIEASQSHVISMAYRYKKPVVATRVGGLPEMVDDGKTGFLVAPRDINALADAITRLMQSDKLRRQFGECGLRKVNIECAPERVGRETRVVYRRAVNDSLPIIGHRLPKEQSSQSSSETFV